MSFFVNKLGPSKDDPMGIPVTPQYRDAPQQATPAAAPQAVRPAPQTVQAKTAPQPAPAPEPEKKKKKGWF